MGSRRSVEYSGTVSEDGNTIKGKWRILVFRGAWSAQRQNDNLSWEQEIKRVEKIPVATSTLK